MTVQQTTYLVSPTKKNAIKAKGKGKLDFIYDLFLFIFLAG